MKEAGNFRLWSENENPKIKRNEAKRRQRCSWFASENIEPTFWNLFPLDKLKNLFLSYECYNHRWPGMEPKEEPF